MNPYQSLEILIWILPRVCSNPKRLERKHYRLHLLLVLMCLHKWKTSKIVFVEKTFLIGEQQPIGGTNSSGVEDALSPCAKKIHVQPKDAALAQIMVQRKLFWNWKKRCFLSHMTSQFCWFVITLPLNRCIYSLWPMIM